MANKATVKISAATLNALRQMLFSSQEGVNLSPIVNDLAGKEDSAQRDEAAINVALTFKGIVPKIDSAEARYESLNDWNKSYYLCQFERYSLILDRVYYTSIQFKIKEGEWEKGKEVEHNSCSLEDWYDKPTDISEFVAKYTPVVEETPAILNIKAYPGLYNQPWLRSGITIFKPTPGMSKVVGTLKI